jgi:sodium transport system permease protein
MRFDLVKVVFAKELRETLRDRRSMIVMFGVPLLLYPLLTILLGGLTASRQKQMSELVLHLAVVNATDAPGLIERIVADPAKFALIQTSEPDEALKASDGAAAVLVVPPGAERDALASRDVQIEIRVDRSKSEAPIVERRLNQLLTDYQEQIVRRRLAPLDADPDKVLKKLKWTTTDVASDSQRLGKILSLMLPNILLLTGMLGAFFPALNTTTTEREAGTLETLLVTPAGRTEILVAKGALVLLSALLTSLMNLVSMSLVMWRYLSSLGEAGDSPLLGHLSISPAALALAFLAAVPALVFFASLVIVVGLFARNFREANSYATLVMLLPLISVGASIAEPAATPGTLMTPVVNTTITIRDALTGRLTVGAFALSFLSSCLYAALMLSAAARLFANEQLVNPSWEPLSLRGLKRLAQRPRGLPSIESAMVLFAIVMLLLFYVTPSAVKWGLVPLVAVNQLLLILAPVLVLALIARWTWTTTFAWRPTTLAALAGGALLGIGASPWANLFVAAQYEAWAPDPASRIEQSQWLLGSLTTSPIPKILLIAALAGVCEEMLFRGPIQTALAQRMRPWIALTVGGFIFAAAHLDLHNVPVRLLLGMMLGWLVLRTGSIFPAMLAHGAYDLVQLALATWAVHSQGLGQVLEQMRTANLASALTMESAVQLVIGAALAATGVWLLRRAPIRAEVVHGHRL